MRRQSILAAVPPSTTVGLLGVLVLAAGCSRPSKGTHGRPQPVLAPPTYPVTVNALGNSDPTTYWLCPGDPNVPPEDLMFRELAACAHRVLQANGFKQTHHSRAQQVIRLHQARGVRVEQRRHQRKFARPRIVDIPLHVHELTITAHDNKTGQRLWETRLSYVGGTADVRAIMPILLAGGQDYLGRSSGQEVTVMVAENDERLALIRGAVSDNQQ